MAPNNFSNTVLENQGAIIIQKLNKNSKIYVAGHRGMVGSAIYRKLQKEGYTNLCGATSTELDLRDAASVDVFFQENGPEYVFLAAAKVGEFSQTTIIQLIFFMIT